MHTIILQIQIIVTSFKYNLPYYFHQNMQMKKGLIRSVLEVGELQRWWQLRVLWSLINSLLELVREHQSFFPLLTCYSTKVWALIFEWSPVVQMCVTNVVINYIRQKTIMIHNWIWNQAKEVIILPRTKLKLILL